MGGDGRGDVDGGGEVRVLPAETPVVRGGGGGRGGGEVGDDEGAAAGERRGLAAADEAWDGDCGDVCQQPRGKTHRALLPWQRC